MLKYTQNYIFFVSEDENFENGDYVFYSDHIHKVVDITKDPVYGDVVLLEGKQFIYFHEALKIEYYFPLSEHAQELNLPLLPDPFVNQDEIKQLAKEYAFNNVSKLFTPNSFHDAYYDVSYNARIEGFIAGVKHKKDQLFTLEDMWNACLFGFDSCNNNWDPEEMSSEVTNENFIQFLIEKTKKLPSEFTVSKDYVCKNCFNDQNNQKYKDCHGNYGIVEVPVIKTNKDEKQQVEGVYKYF